MKKRKQRLFELPRGSGNTEYYGLCKGQRVMLQGSRYRGSAVVSGEPPQGPGIYVDTKIGKLLVSGEEIAEATEPS